MKTLFHIEAISPFLEPPASSFTFLSKKQEPIGIRDCENYKRAYLHHIM